MELQPTPTDFATELFVREFGRPPALVALAPGRVNLIGEHTDYNDGFVLPAAINFHIAIAAAPRPDQKLQVIARDQGEQRVAFSLDAPAQRDDVAPWSNYIRGVVAELMANGFTLRGADLAISGNIPLGAGLSSSAALEMATIAAVTNLVTESIDPTAMALIGQAAENNFVGMQCGIMDQLVCAAGKAGHALLIDCRSLALQPVPIPEDLSILVINSNVRHTLVDGQYNDRRRQCERARDHFGVHALRDVSSEQLQSGAGVLDATVYQRARHVISENQRTVDLYQALQSNRSQLVGPLMAQSHASMRDDFEITVPEIDALVSIVQDVLGSAGGVRMTGGGFGGSVVALLPPELIEPTLAAVSSHYPKQTGKVATPFVCHASSGAFAYGEMAS